MTSVHEIRVAGEVVAIVTAFEDVEIKHADRPDVTVVERPDEAAELDAKLAQPSAQEQPLQLL